MRRNGESFSLHIIPLKEDLLTDAEKLDARLFIRVCFPERGTCRFSIVLHS